MSLTDYESDLQDRSLNFSESYKYLGEHAVVRPASKIKVDYFEIVHLLKCHGSLITWLNDSPWARVYE